MTTIDAEERDALIDALAAYPKRLRALIDGEDEEDLKRAGPGGSWGVVESLCFLRDSEELFITRMEKMLDEDNPVLKAVEDSLWPIDRDYLSQNPHQVIEEFAAYRKQSINLLLETSVADWERTGKHPRHGQVTIRQYAEHIARRDAEYEQQIQRALRRETPDG